jgi:hypothetical protein
MKIMCESVLNLDENLGFCTLIEITKSRLFSHGIHVSPEDFHDNDYSFSVSVPPLNSREFVQLWSILRENSNPQNQELQGLTPILIEVSSNENILSWSSERQSKFASNLANRFLRAYEHTYFDVWVPRHRLDGREIVLVTSEKQNRLEYDPVLLDIDDILIDYLPSHIDTEKMHLGYLMASPDSISPSWRILIDGVRHFENGNLREAILCACSSAEIIASPLVEKWLNGNTLIGSRNVVENAVREMGNPLRFEFCISGACSNAFSDLDDKERRELLKELHQMNSLRNKVVHQGNEPDVNAVANALRFAAKFVSKSWSATLES